MSNIGIRLKALREANNISQRDLGDAINLAFSSISAIENGRSESKEALRAIAEYFKVPFEWLVNGEGENPKGVVVPIKPQAEAPWRDETLAFLKAENQRLWKLVEKLSGAPAGSIANFSSAVGKAGKQISLLSTVKAA